MKDRIKEIENKIQEQREIMKEYVRYAVPKK